MSLKRFNSEYYFLMYYKIKTLTIIGVVVFAIIACSQALYIPTQADTQKTGVSTDTLVLGRKLYVKNCASCHSLYQPERYTIKEWEKAMPSMQIKAKCNNQDAAIITKYLNARAK
jgi:mono/diheme cytochrome c family protein